MKESSGTHQYGLNTTDGVNMVVLMVTDTLQQNVDGATAIDGENAFNAMKGKRYLTDDFRHSHKLQFLSKYGTWNPLSCGTT